LVLANRPSSEIFQLVGAQWRCGTDRVHPDRFGEQIATPKCLRIR
jgi:hypothetical protein